MKGLLGCQLCSNVLSSVCDIDKRFLSTLWVVFLSITFLSAIRRCEPSGKETGDPAIPPLVNFNLARHLVLKVACRIEAVLYYSLSTAVSLLSPELIILSPNLWPNSVRPCTSHINIYNDPVRCSVG